MVSFKQTLCQQQILVVGKLTRRWLKWIYSLLLLIKVQLISKSQKRPSCRSQIPNNTLTLHRTKRQLTQVNKCKQKILFACAPHPNQIMASSTTRNNRCGKLGPIREESWTANPFSSCREEESLSLMFVLSQRKMDLKFLLFFFLTHFTIDFPLFNFVNKWTK